MKHKFKAILLLCVLSFISVACLDDEALDQIFGREPDLMVTDTAEVLGSVSEPAVVPQNPEAIPLVAAENNYAWVLVEILDFENADHWATADAHPSYAVSHVYSRGVYSASTTYEETGDGRSGTLGLNAVFTGMPEIIYPDQTVSLNLSFTITENSVVNLGFAGDAKADFDQWDLGPGAATGGSKLFVNKDGKYHFAISNANPPFSYNETLTAQLGPGTEGERIALRTIFYMGESMGTNYVYEWKQVGE